MVKVVFYCGVFILKKNEKKRRLFDYIRIMVHQRATPEAIALGVCIGVFVGLSPFYGLQMLFALLLAILLKASKLAAVLSVWITNPLTALPVYSFTFVLGSQALGMPLKNKSLRSFLQFCMDEFQWQNIDRPHKILVEAYHLGKGVLPPLLAGGFIVALLASLICYPLTRFAVYRLRHRRRNRLKKTSMEWS